MGCSQFAAFVSSALFLCVVLLSYPRPNKFPPPPPQENSPITGFPSWREYLEEYDFQTVYTPSLYAIMINGITGLAALYWTFIYKQPKSTISFFHQGNEVAPATLFNAILAIYVLVTQWASIAGIIVDLSKLWVPIGVIHNAAELAFVTLLYMGGKVASNLYFVGIGIYMITVVSCCMIFPWPYDAFFFKAQGLVLDYMIVVLFTRVILETRSQFQSDAEGHIPIVDQEDDEGRERLTARAKLYPTTVNHPHQLHILLVAGFIHLLGNTSFILPYHIPDQFPTLRVLRLSGHTLSEYLAPETHLPTQNDQRGK
ncbi:7677_t:CDS:2 [Ambispora gerdemannii]|uniref:7677_t:CDS:1 n=1 Tax=Ambispora gerdemannii TaxID=144530 RepID=A0A9N8V366_9GLOM|nr:7677_t:CDS:2 [Ambispora gerdemannii]